MDKNAIKKFAVWARTELIARVSLKGVEYGITEDKIEDANADSVGGKVLTADEKKQRQALIAEINDKGYKQVMEEVAYTWFNRFSALRFMEVNGYLPSHVRVFRLSHRRTAFHSRPAQAFALLPAYSWVSACQSPGPRQYRQGTEA